MIRLTTLVISLIGLAVALASCAVQADGPNSASSPSANPVAVDSVALGTWTLRAGTVDGQPLVPSDDKPLTLVITADGISGSAGCNGFSAPLDGSVAEMLTGPITSTRMACPQPAMSIETSYLDALDRASAATPAGDRLVISGEGVELVFVAG